MHLTSIEQWQEWAPNYTVLPYIQGYALEQTAIPEWIEAWRNNAHSVLLESGKGGRFSYLGLHPISMIRGKGGEAEVFDFDPNGSPVKRGKHTGEPLSLVQDWVGAEKLPRLSAFPPFVGGCVGYWSYDVIRSMERIPSLSEDDLRLPDYIFLRFHELWIVDHVEHVLYCSVITKLSPDMHSDRLLAVYAAAVERAGAMKRYWDRMMGSAAADSASNRMKAYQSMEQSELLKQDDSVFMPELTEAFPKALFIKAVKQIQEYIRLHDVDQVNLSLRQHHVLRCSSVEVYEWLRLVNPSPYMALLRFPDFQIVSGSPELLVKKEGDRVTTRPIGGTRKRSHDIEEDVRLLRELQDSEKDRAEHMMLVDVLCEDVGRIALDGTVKVEELLVLESYSHVHHLVSLISGTVADSHDAFDVIRAMFPGGSITGAPKVRTMEIIEELEPVRRGIYTGSIGWIDYSGDMEFNIVIRTLIVKDQIGYVQAGAGIVQNSIPEREYEESIQKAKALWKAVQYCEAVEE